MENSSLNSQEAVRAIVREVLADRVTIVGEQTYLKLTESNIQDMEPSKVFGKAIPEPSLDIKETLEIIFLAAKIVYQLIEIYKRLQVKSERELKSEVFRRKLEKPSKISNKQMDELVRSTVKLFV